MESEQVMLPGWALAQQSYSPADGAASSEKDASESGRKPRFQPINREQLFWRQVDVERLITEDHAARAIWEFVGKLEEIDWVVEDRNHLILRRVRKTASKLRSARHGK